MKITFYAHAAFLIETRDGTRLILDPYLSGGLGGSISYQPIGEGADAVIASHEHEDHNATQTILGEPLVLVQPRLARVGDVSITSLSVFHDETEGSQRGSNCITILDDGDIRLAHLGDLGHDLSPQTVKAMGDIDVMLVPVGGFYTIDAATAARIMERVVPRVVIPMHYKTDRIDFPIAPITDFLADRSDVKYVQSPTVELTKDNLPGSTTVVVLEASR